MNKLIISLLLLLISFPAMAQETTEDLTLKFFEIYEEDSDKAIDYLFETNKWVQSNKDGIENLKFKLRQAINLMGEFVGFEKIADKTLGESLNAAVYMVKYERQPLRFIFKYYRSSDTWMIYNFKFDEDLDDDLEEMMKYDYLN